jgi:hypothetical protein
VIPRPRSASTLWRFAEAPLHSKAPSALWGLVPHWANGVFAFRHFPLHGPANFGTVIDVRWIIPITTLFALVSTAVGQRQDDKLVERLLRPNVATVNPAQTKQFTTRNAGIEKESSVKNINLSDKTVVMPTFESSRTLSPREFAVRHFRTGASITGQDKQFRARESATVEVFSSANGSRIAQESDHTATTDSFRGSRSFVLEGKSQKSLHGYDRPLTLEQVRELLNKNK